MSSDFPASPAASPELQGRPKEHNPDTWVQPVLTEVTYICGEQPGRRQCDPGACSLGGATPGPGLLPTLLLLHRDSLRGQVNTRGIEPIRHHTVPGGKGTLQEAPPSLPQWQQISRLATQAPYSAVTILRFVPLLYWSLLVMHDSRIHVDIIIKAWSILRAHSPLSSLPCPYLYSAGLSALYLWVSLIGLLMGVCMIIHDPL